MAEVDISVLTEQCLDRRMGRQVIVGNEIGAWESERNAARATIDWRFKIPNARDKLKKLYPERRVIMTNAPPTACVSRRWVGKYTFGYVDI